MPEVDAGRDVAVADARQRAIVEADRALVVERGAAGVGGAAVADRGLARLAAELEVTRDVLERGRGAALGPHLEPARAGRVVAAAAIVVDRAVDQVPQVRVGERELALARHRGHLGLEQPLALDQVAERGGDREPRVIAGRRDLGQRRAIGIGRGQVLGAVEGDHRVEPAALADDRRHLEHAPLRPVHDREPRVDQLLVGAGQVLRGEADRVEAPRHPGAAHDALALEQEPHQLVDRARRAAERARVHEQALGHLIERLAQLAQQRLGLARGQRAQLDALGRVVAVAEARVALGDRRGRGRDQQHRRGREAGGEVLDEVDRLGARLLDVLDHEHERLAIGVRGEEAAQRQERAGLELLRRLDQRADHRAVLERDVEQLREQVRDLGDARGGQDLGDPGLDLVAALGLGLADDDPEARAEEADDRAVGGVDVGGAGPHLGGGRDRGGGLAQLADQAALAHPGLADHDRERQRPVGGRPLERGAQRPQRAHAPGEAGPQLVRDRRDDGLLALTVAEQLASVERGHAICRESRWPHRVESPFANHRDRAERRKRPLGTRRIRRSMHELSPLVVAPWTERRET